MELMPKIIDATIFYNENDVFDIRVQELYPVVDAFVVLMANQTFRGNPKPDYFDYQRFSKYRDKLSILTLDLDNAVYYEELKTPWQREIAQRNWLNVAVAKTHSEMNFENDCTIIFGDVDEIPRRSVVRPVEEMHRLKLDKYSYAINMLTDEGNSSVRMLPYWQFFHNKAEDMRRGDEGIIVENAGWEFSSLGTPEQIMTKFQSFSHDEFDNQISVELFRQRIEAGQDLLGRDIGMTPVEIDDTFPEAIKADPERWREFVW